MATLTQSHFRFGIESATESTHGWWANEDVNLSQEISANWTFLLRFCEQVTTAISNVDAQFQYNKNGAGWVNITTSSAIVKAVASVAFTDGQACTKRLSGTGTFETTGAGCTENGLSGGTANDIVLNGNSETEAALQVVYADVANGDTIQFRLTSPDATMAYNVTPTLTITFGVTAVGDTVQTIWHVRQAVGDTSQHLFHVRASIGDTIQTIWNVRSSIGKTSQHIWNVLASFTAVGDTIQVIWHVRQSIGKTNQSIWHVRALASKAVQVIYNVRQTVGDTTQHIWNIRQVVGKTNQHIWHTRASVGDTIQAVWNVLSNFTAVGKSIQFVWHVYIVGQTKRRLSLTNTIKQGISLTGTIKEGLILTSTIKQDLSLTSTIKEGLILISTIKQGLNLTSSWGGE